MHASTPTQISTTDLLISSKIHLCLFKHHAESITTVSQRVCKGAIYIHRFLSCLCLGSRRGELHLILFKDFFGDIVIFFWRFYVDALLRTRRGNGGGRERINKRPGLICGPMNRKGDVITTLYKPYVTYKKSVLIYFMGGN